MNKIPHLIILTGLFLTTGAFAKSQRFTLVELSPYPDGHLKVETSQYTRFLNCSTGQVVIKLPHKPIQKPIRTGRQQLHLHFKKASIQFLNQKAMLKPHSLVVKCHHQRVTFQPGSMVKLAWNLNALISNGAD